jgi:hypothetical protein
MPSLVGALSVAHHFGFLASALDVANARSPIRQNACSFSPFISLAPCHGSALCTQTENAIPRIATKSTKMHEKNDRHTRTCAFRLFVFLRVFRGYLLPSAEFAFSVELNPATPGTCSRVAAKGCCQGREPLESEINDHEAPEGRKVLCVPVAPPGNAVEHFSRAEGP